MKKIKFISVIAFWLLMVISTAFVDSPQSVPTSSVELGEVLFNDKILSIDQSISCASCHIPDFAFADTSSLSPGVNNNYTERNTPSVMYLADKKHFFWDGRAKSFEEQALGPIASPKEMGLPLDEAEKRLVQSSYYQKAFRTVFDSEPSLQLLAKALADYQRTLQPNESPYDRYVAGDINALNAAEVRGMELFIYDANCVFCHKEPYFGNEEFFNIGLFDGKTKNDNGRFMVTHDSTDIGAFETPTLRNIALTAPYMHDGSMRTLKEVLEYYNEPDKHVPNSKNRHANMTPLKMNSKHIEDLEAFLRSLTDDRFKKTNVSKKL